MFGFFFNYQHENYMLKIFYQGAGIGMTLSLFGLLWWWIGGLLCPPYGLPAGSPIVQAVDVCQANGTSSQLPHTIERYTVANTY